MYEIADCISFSYVTLVLLLSWFWRKACNPIARDQPKNLNLGVRMRDVDVRRAGWKCISFSVVSSRPAQKAMRIILFFQLNNLLKRAV